MVGQPGFIPEVRMDGSTFNYGRMCRFVNWNMGQLVHEFLGQIARGCNGTHFT